MEWSQPPFFLHSQLSVFFAVVVIDIIIDKNLHSQSSQRPFLLRKAQFWAAHLGISRSLKRGEESDNFLFDFLVNLPLALVVWRSRCPVGVPG